MSPFRLFLLYDGDNPYADFNSSGTLTYRYLYGQRLDTLLARFERKRGRSSIQHNSGDDHDG